MFENDVDRNGLRLPSSVRNPPRTFDDLDDDDEDVKEEMEDDMATEESPAAGASTPLTTNAGEDS